MNIQIRKLLSILVIGILSIAFAANAQTGINTRTPDPNAALDIVSSSKGVLIPRLSNMEVTALEGNSPAKGMLLYNIDKECVQIFLDDTFECTDVTTDSWKDNNSAARIELAYLSDGATPRPEHTELVALNNGDIGIGTVSPVAKLDVREKNPTSPTAGAGIAVPQVGNLPPSGNRAGQIIYLTPRNKYHYYDGSAWKCLDCGTSVGDIKQSLKVSDHDGWVKLDGRSTGTLTSSQQANAAMFGFTSNLPNASNAYLVQNGASLGSVSGSNTKTINRNQLPNITLNATGTTNTTGAHTHSYTDRGNTTFTAGGGTVNPIADDTSGSYTTGSAGDHSHTVTATTESLNGNVTQGGFDITPRSLSVNTFIYLGL